MSEWKTYRLGEICKNVCSGGTPKSTEPLYYGGDIPWLNTKEVDFCRIDKTEKTITDLGFQNSSAKWVEKNSVIVAMYGATAAKVAINTIPLTTNQACCNLTVNADFADFRFVYFYLCYKYASLAALANGGAQQNLNAQRIKDFEITVPSLNEQKRIADVLWALDDKIELNRRINANLEEQAQALFKSWFVTDKNKKLQYYEIGDVASITAGGDKPSVYSKELTEQCKIPIYSNGIESEGLYGYTDLAKIKDASITISARGTIGYVCLRKKPYFPIVRLISVTPNNVELSAEFLYLWALTQNISGTGTTQQQLTVPDFRKTLIGIPKEKTLKKFNNIVIPIFQKIEMNKEENEKLSTLRDTLLPKLMKGEIKVKE
ncbi:MAG TPA: restriction endonuclease subunit S [Candidatus Barnesiella merdigallinarum]|nr:restriction endonuclease subunit S [Candidatus Barnesiella merdigallinarum]